jgi:hypothetical protein
MTAGSGDDDLTVTDVDSFLDFVRFVARNDLWDEAKAALESQNIHHITVSSAPIRAVRQLIDEELLPGDRLSGSSRRHALAISHCECGGGGGGDDDDGGNDEGDEGDEGDDGEEEVEE